MLIKNEILHDKDCPYLEFQGEKETSLDELIDWAKRYRCCERCRRIALVHSGITDIENYLVHYNFFDGHKISLAVLQESANPVSVTVQTSENTQPIWPTIPFCPQS